MKYIRKDYPYKDNETREEIEVTEGVAYLLVIIGSGNGYDVVSVAAGDSWREGWDEELLGVYATREEAEAALNSRD